MLRFVQILYFDFEIAVAGFFMEESESLARVLEPRPRLCLLQAWLNSFFAHLVHFFLPHCGSACCFLSADQLRLLLLFTLFYCCYSVVQRVFIFGWTKNIVRLGCLLSGDCWVQSGCKCPFTAAGGGRGGICLLLLLRCNFSLMLQNKM